MPALHLSCASLDGTKPGTYSADLRRPLACPKARYEAARLGGFRGANVAPGSPRRLALGQTRDLGCPVVWRAPVTLERAN